MPLTARRALFTVLILLTAFRGAVGDAMAYGMTGQAIAINSVASSAYSAKTSGHFDIKKSASMPCHEAADVPNAEVTSQAACSTCQVCHLSVSLPFSPATQLAAMPNERTPSLPARVWASADLALLAKPPIV